MAIDCLPLRGKLLFESFAVQLSALDSHTAPSNLCLPREMAAERPNDQVRRIIDASTRVGIDAADEAVLRSILHSASEKDVGLLLDEFFDVELIVRALFDEFLDRGTTWDATVHRRLFEALIFCGLDEEARRIEPSAA